MFSFLITLSIFMYLFWLCWIFVLRVSFYPGVRRSLLISVASPVAEARALGAWPLAAADHGLLGARPSAAADHGLLGARPSAAADHRLLGAWPLAAVDHGLQAPGLGSCSTWAWWLWPPGSGAWAQ